MATDRTLIELEAALAASPRSYAAAKAVLKFLDQHPARVPALERRAACSLLEHHAGRLGDGAWGLRERALVAALDEGDVSGAHGLVNELQARFGRSSERVQCLRGMVHEAVGAWAEAETVYDEVLRANPVQPRALQRRACARWARGDGKGAVDAMNEYLKLVPADADAWAELADWYLADEKLALAKFCAEELILLRPQSYATNLLYAEVLYTLGGDKNYVRARQYFAQSLELKPEGNLRALYGLCAALKAKRPAGDKAAALPSWAAARVLAEYRRAAPAAEAARVERWLAAA